MSIKSLMNYTFVSKYARWDEQKERRETWGESVDRVKQMMLDKYVYDPTDKLESKAQGEVLEAIETAYEEMKKRKYLDLKELCSLVDRQFLSTIQEYIIVLLHTLIEQDSSKNVCTCCCAVVELDFQYKNITLLNFQI